MLSVFNVARPTGPTQMMLFKAELEVLPVVGPDRDRDAG